MPHHNAIGVQRSLRQGGGHDVGSGAADNHIPAASPLNGAVKLPLHVHSLGRGLLDKHRSPDRFGQVLGVGGQRGSLIRLFLGVGSMGDKGVQDCGNPLFDNRGVAGVIECCRMSRQQ